MEKTIVACFMVCRSWRTSLRYSLLPLSSTKFSTPFCLCDSSDHFDSGTNCFPTVTVPIATQMVHGTKTFEILGTAPVHQETLAETVEGFRDRRASSLPPMIVTAPVLEAPPAVVEYREPAPRCGVRGARTRGHEHTCCSRCHGFSDHNDSGANSFPCCATAT